MMKVVLKEGLKRITEPLRLSRKVGLNEFFGGLVK